MTAEEKTQRLINRRVKVFHREMKKATAKFSRDGIKNFIFPDGQVFKCTGAITELISAPEI